MLIICQNLPKNREINKEVLGFKWVQIYLDLFCGFKKKKKKRVVATLT